MEHEDGYCDRCGAELEDAWLTFDGQEFCDACARNEVTQPSKVTAARRPEARDDGR